MLAAVVNEHRKNATTPLRKEAQVKKEAAVKAVDDLVTIVLSHFGKTVAKAYQNQRQIEFEMQRMSAQIGLHQRHLAEWSRLLHNFDKSLKELGDVDNWAIQTERQLLHLDSCLQLALTNKTDNSLCHSETTLD